MRACLATLGCVALAGGATAHAASPAPRLVVHERGTKAAAVLELRHVADVGSVAILVPAGYVLAADPAQPPGTQVGTLSADLVTDTVTQTASGPVVVAPPGTAACDGAAHAQTWTAALTSAGETVATLTLAADASPARVLLCLAGMHAERLNLQLPTRVLAPPTQPARPVWEALVTLAEGSQVASVATLVLPARLTLRGAYQRPKHTIAVSGTLLEGGAPAPAGRRVVVSIGPRPTRLTTIGATRTRPDGTWWGVITNVRRPLFVQAQAIVPEADTTATGCTPPTLTVPCVSATAAGYTLTTAALRVAVP